MLTSGGLFTVKPEAITYSFVRVYYDAKPLESVIYKAFRLVS